MSADLLTANRYALAGGNPVTFVEYDGHVVVPNGGGGGATTSNPSGSPTSTTTSPTSTDAHQAFREAERRSMEQYQERQRAEERRRLALQAGRSVAGGAISAGFSIAELGSEAGTGLADYRHGNITDPQEASRHGRHLSRFSHDRNLRDVGRFFRQPGVQALGRGLTAVGIATTTIGNFTDAGLSGDEAVLKSSVQIGIGLVAGLGTTALCAATVLVGCLVSGATIAIASGFLGEGAGQLTVEAKRAVADWGRSTWNSIFG